MKRVLVIGAGVAGTAAALSAKQAGADVAIVSGSVGASGLASGAIDLEPWERATTEPAELDAFCTALLARLGATVGPASALVASASGLVRPARGRDLALLDLASLPAGRVFVADADASGWDAAALCRAWNAAPRARKRQLSFEPLAGHFLKHTGERAMTAVEIAARHDAPERLAWLGSALRDALAKAGACVAVVLPPWLGASAPRANALGSIVGVACGEAIALSGGPAGRRFEAQRDRALADAGVESAQGWVTRVTTERDEVTVELEGGDARTCDAVVLAVGGLVGGGIVYTPAEAILATAVPPYPRNVFSCAIDVAVAIGEGGKELVVPGSMFGLPAEQTSWPFSRDPLSERVGVLSRGSRAAERVYVAGDCMADRARTWVAAMQSGAAAGTGAAG